MGTEMIVVGAIRMDELPKRVKRKISIMGQDWGWKKKKSATRGWVKEDQERGM